LGIQKTYDRVCSQFCWPGMRACVVRFVRSCDVCQQCIPRGRVAPVPLGKMPVIDILFKRVAVVHSRLHHLREIDMCCHLTMLRDTQKLYN